MHRAVLHSPLHDIEVIVSDKGVNNVRWISADDSTRLQRICKLQSKPSQMEKIHLDDTAKWLEALWNKQNLPNLPDLAFPDATQFQSNVWQQLAKTPCGSTLSYKQLAKLAGSENASRAVGSAMANNPITILVPCHRVVQSDGKMGNYSGYGGIKTKQWLLKLESNY